MIRAVIFDMDGLLIDTEPYWQATEREVFGDLGINITKKMQVATFGLRSDEVVSYYYGQYPWKEKSLEEVEECYNNRVLEYFRTKAELMEGARSALDFISSKGWPVALASSSNMQLINAFLDRFGFHHYFQEVYSAEFEPYGKPHPGVYLETARRLNVDPVNCLALEDSFHGLIAAKAARMMTIAVPEHADKRFGAADVVLNSLRELNDEVLRSLDDKMK
jgi:mannitol-1-/sugar-/sorbitol-6-/2-deoxyglucose-6-phosphatase